MNGRVYLPELGVFLSPDPFMQFPESTQGYNRYAYVSNNPLSYTDPSGYMIWALAAAVASNFVSTQVAVVLAAIAGYLETGTIKGAFLYAASAGVAAGINAAFPSGIELTAKQVLQRAILHGVTQGAVAAVGGGRFRDGALGGFVGGYLGGHFERKGGTGNPVLNILVIAIIGGTASEVGGGKFANGAISAAFVAALSPRRGGPSSNRNSSDLSLTELVALPEAELFAEIDRLVVDLDLMNSDTWLAECGVCVRHGIAERRFLRQEITAVELHEHYLAEVQGAVWGAELVMTGGMVRHAYRAMTVPGYLGPSGPIFGSNWYRGRGNAGMLNHGPVRLGWSFRAKTGVLYFSLRIGEKHVFNWLGRLPPPR